MEDVEIVQKGLQDFWQINDPRLKGCLDISRAITDIFEGCASPMLLDYLELSYLPKPLALAEAMRIATERMQSLTKKSKKRTKTDRKPKSERQ